MIDGYTLYNQLAAGEAYTADIESETYRFQFKGTRYGSNNWLEVTAKNGETKKWGWGWNSEVCWRCLNDLEEGWDAQQKRPYKPYEGSMSDEPPAG